MIAFTYESGNKAEAIAGTGGNAALQAGEGGGMTAMARTTGRKGALQPRWSRVLALGMAVVLMTCGGASAALIPDAEVAAARATVERTEDALKAAEKALAKQAAALKEAVADEAELTAELAKLKAKLADAPARAKGSLSTKVRRQQEAINTATTERAALEADVARTTAQVDNLRGEVAKATAAHTDLTARQKDELAAWEQRQVEEKAAAKAAAKDAKEAAKAAKAAAEEAAKAAKAAADATPAVTAAPVVAAPVAVAAPAPAVVEAAPAPAAPAPAADLAPLEQKVEQATAGKAQAEAVVTQRAEDLERAKDAKARRKAADALSDAEKVAAAKKKEEQAAAAELEAARQQPAAVTPRAFAHTPQVSEPAPWAPPAAPEPAPVLRGDQRLTVPEAAVADIAPAGEALQFDVAMLAGDKDIAEDLDVWKEWASYITFASVTPTEINEFHGRLTKALHEKGYVFAKVTFPTRIWSTGIFLAKVDCGPLGTITVKGNRHYSAKQIINALADQDGARFNYARVHGDLFDLNARPDLNIDAKLRPSIQDGRRVVDADLEVEDSLPIHGALEISNTGTDDTSDWRIRSSLQHVNLTKHDDVLTVEWLTSPDVSDVNAYSAAYFLPLDDRWSMNIYAGLSDSDIEDVLPQLDIRGRGHFAGAQFTRVLEETPRYRTQLSLGWLYQYWENEQEIAGFTWEDRRLRLSMPSATFGYSSRVFDSLGGRNFASITAMANFAGNYGSSTKDEFIGEGGTGFTDGDFALARFQLARLQRFFKGEDQPGKWTVFMRADGQFSGDSLPPPVRRSLGGANSVRGYEEAEVAGDNAVTATIELRTPLFSNFIPGLKKSQDFLDANPEAWQQHRLQFVVFSDLGWLENKEPLPGVMDSETLASVGAGLRLGFTKYSQMRLDYGYPLEDTTEDTPSSGRFHLSLQVQF